MTIILSAVGFLAVCFLAGYLAERAAYRSLIGDRDIDDVVSPHTIRKE